MKRFILSLIFTVLFCGALTAQVPIEIGIQLLKAEDARRYDAVLENLMKSPNAAIRGRAALAAGRIGDDKAVAAISDLLGDRKNSGQVWATAVFALGEIESIKGAEGVTLVIKSESGYVLRDPELLSRAFEAAGKIAAANPKDPQSKELGEVILQGLELEKKSAEPSPVVIRQALTAILRVQQANAEDAVRPFLASRDPEVVTTALNTLARLRAKSSNSETRELLKNHADPNVRANAARVLGAAEDKDSFGILLATATTDVDPRVRISAIRSLGSLKDAKAADKLIERGNSLLIPIHGDPTPLKLGQKVGVLKPIEVPLQKSELLEIATAVGRLLANTENKDAIQFLIKLRVSDKYQSSETEIAFAQVAPLAYLASKPPTEKAYTDFHVAVAYGQGLSKIAATKNADLIAQAGEKLTVFLTGMMKGVKPKDQAKLLIAMPDLTRSLVALKPDNLDVILRDQLANDDVFIRTAAAESIGEQPMSKENFEALEKAFTVSLLKDKFYNDAMLAILDALAKLDKKAATGSLLMALNSQDYLVRKKVFELLDDKALEKDSPGIPFMVKMAREKHQDQVQPYQSAYGTKLGQILNSDIDYRRALSRKNGSVSAVLTTEKGSFTIVFDPEEAPLTVDNWVKLSRSGYFNGLEVHRVVPNFVKQDGDPRGDGNGGPGWSIRCELNTLPFDRGAVGMALSGKDTGGSQWFVTHSPQPHLDGGYTVFGHVNETDMKVVDNIVRGDKILKVVIVEKAAVKKVR